MGLTNEGANLYALERAGEKPFSPKGRNHKAEGGILFHSNNSGSLFTQ